MVGPGGSYECTFTAYVSGTAGDSEVNTVTVVAFDDEANRVEAAASIRVHITDAPPVSAANTAQSRQDAAASRLDQRWLS